MTLAPREVVQAPARAWRRYVKRKDLGLEWLGEIPDHWNLERLKVAVSAPVKKGYGIRRPFIALEHISSGSGSLVDGYEPEVVAADDYALFEEGDILFGKLRPYLRKYYLATFSGCCPTELLVLRPRNQIFEPKFFNFLVGSSYFVAVANATSYGVKMPRTSWEVMGSQPVPVPSLPEQRVIADFLDRETQKIDNLLVKREHLIGLLEEKRTALISQVVTKGLNPEVPMKDSGVEWLGEIPEHWQVGPLKYETRFINGAAFKPSDWADKGTPIIRIENLNGGGNFNHASHEVDDRYHVRQGDLLFAWSGNRGTSFGPFVWRKEGLYYLNQHIFHLTDFRCDRSWFYWVLKGLTAYVEKQAHGIIGLVHITKHELGNVTIPLVPRYEQQVIAEHLDREIEKIDALVLKVQEHIEKLREYRTALISAAVTGRIDVREENPRVYKSRETVEKAKVNPAFRRAVFAAEIIDQLHEDATFGRVKLQKLLYLGEYHLGLPDFDSNYQRDAAGPFDNRMLRSVTSQLEKARWFGADSRRVRGYLYRPLEKAGGHRKYFESYFGDQRQDFQRLINLMRPLDTAQSEIVATLYAVWNDLLVVGEDFDDARIVRGALTEWHKSKEKIPEDRWRGALGWMRKKGLVPQGYGSKTKRKT